MDEPWCIEIEPEVRQWLERQSAEIERAHQSQKECQAHHGPAAHYYDRIREDGP